MELSRKMFRNKEQSFKPLEIGVFCFVKCFGEFFLGMFHGNVRYYSWEFVKGFGEVSMSHTRPDSVKHTRSYTGTAVRTNDTVGRNGVVQTYVRFTRCLGNPHMCSHVRKQRGTSVRCIPGQPNDSIMYVRGVLLTNPRRPEAPSPHSTPTPALCCQFQTHFFQRSITTQNPPKSNLFHKIIKNHEKIIR